MHTVESLVNPFRPRKVTEPVKATDRITYDLLTAEKKDNAAFVSCVETRLESSDIDLFAQFPKSNLQMFRNLAYFDLNKMKTPKTYDNCSIMLAYILFLIM